MNGALNDSYGDFKVAPRSASELEGYMAFSIQEGGLLLSSGTVIGHSGVQCGPRSSYRCSS
ncbi:MAG: hypothetical protein ACE37F_30790 [Nannocystaceae bacterium]|nr:hypothetical protein [bacterium]